MTCSCGGVPAAAVMPEAGDLEAIGAAVLNLVSATVTVGHATPADTNEYASTAGAPFGPHVVADLVSWSSRRGDWEQAKCRLSHYVTASGWQDRAMSQLAASLGISP